LKINFVGAGLASAQRSQKKQIFLGGGKPRPYNICHNHTVRQSYIAKKNIDEKHHIFILAFWKGVSGGI
jgi:hypothetical protein